jgi:ABC-type glycerol-3-phosphate transport system substrate-binding protein
MTDSNRSGLSRRSLVKALGVGATVGLAGCSGDGASGEMGGDGGSSDGSDESSTSSDGSSSESGGEQALLWEYAFPNDDQPPVWKNGFIDNYEERVGEEPEIARFSYEDLRQKFLTGARTGDPDAIEGVLSHLTEYVKAGHLEPLGDWAEGLDHYDGFVDSALDAMTYKGELYGLPYTGNGRALIYRTDIFEELRQDPQETAAEYHEVGRMINEEYDDMRAYHNCTKDGSVRAFQEWMSHVYQHTDQLYVPDGDGWSLNIEADQLGQIFDNWYAKVWAGDNPVANPDQLGTGWQVNDPGYLNGQFAMIDCGTWLRGWTSGDNINDSDATSQLLNNNTAVTHLPYGEGGSQGTFLEVKPIMLNSHSDNKEKAKEILAAWTDPDTLASGAEDSPGNFMTPVHNDIESTITNEDWEPFTDVFETGRALAKIGWGPVREEFYPLMQEVAYGRTDPYDAGQSLHEGLSGLESEL